LVSVSFVRLRSWWLWWLWWLWWVIIIIIIMIPFNRPDITFMNKKTKNSFLIDTAVTNTHNLAETIADNKTNTNNS
jgi:hypothetical protein